MPKTNGIWIYLSTHVKYFVLLKQFAILKLSHAIRRNVNISIGISMILHHGAFTTTTFEHFAKAVRWTTSSSFSNEISTFLQLRAFSFFADRCLQNRKCCCRPRWEHDCCKHYQNHEHKIVLALHAGQLLHKCVEISLCFKVFVWFRIFTLEFATYFALWKRA